MNIRKFFDTVSWDLTLKAVAHHTDQRWILLYVKRWLKARCSCGTAARSSGLVIPQGSAIGSVCVSKQVLQAGRSAQLGCSVNHGYVGQADATPPNARKALGLARE